MLIHANAQTFTDRVQQKAEGKGTVTIHQSSEIEQLVNDPAATGVQQPPTQSNDGKQTAPSKEDSHQAQKPTTPQTTPDGEDDDAQPAQVTSRRRMVVLRVQVYAGNSGEGRRKAEQIGNSIKAKIPNVPVYVRFHSPRWVCRVGNFRTNEEALQMQQKLQNMGYNQSLIVKDVINVTN